MGRRRVRSLAMAIAVGGCSAGTSVGAPEPTASSSTTETPIATTTTTTTTTSTIAASDTTIAPPVPASSSTTNATSTTTPAGSPSSEPERGGLDVGESAEDPSFELGPDVVLDVDLARFPPDDAGQGGGAAGDAAPSDTPASTGWAAVDQSLEDGLLRSGNTSASFAVSIDGDVVHAAAFGVREPAIGDPAETVDRFRVASISKPITAIVAMRLVIEGVVDLDEPIGERVGAHVGLASVSSGTASLTLRDLLTHRSGFGVYQSTFFRGGADDCVDAARQGLSRGAGGGGYTYSNMNYCVAGLVIEALTGLDYEAAVYRELLTPLGISGMRLAPTIDPGPDEVQHATTPGRNYMETLGGAGAWIASPSELVTILDSLDLSTPGYKPVPLETALDMITPAGGVLGQRGYGLGLISYGGGRFGHTGTIESTHAMLLNRGDGVSWAITVAGPFPSESTSLERFMNDAFTAGGFVAG